MLYVKPSYYDKFKCIAGACHHNCCIGWEIDIDSDTLKYYDSVDGEFGERLQNEISRGETPHFILGEHERCPFLNKNNLCDIILTLGEAYICGICTEHPRFHNELPGRVESGIGLCCEEAARLILSEKETVTLVTDGETNVDDEIISVRDEVIEILQDRSLSIDERIGNMLEFCGTSMIDTDISEWADIFLGLERLDSKWTKLLEDLRGFHPNNEKGFNRHMSDRWTEYEQLIIYFVYRHMANSPDEDEIAIRAKFAVLSMMMIRMIGLMLWEQNGDFTLNDQVEIARMYSSEVEYSEDNMEELLDILCELD